MKPLTGPNKSVIAMCYNWIITNNWRPLALSSFLDIQTEEKLQGKREKMDRIVSWGDVWEQNNKLDIKSVYACVPA